jgi:hypothetical protein
MDEPKKERAPLVAALSVAVVPLAYLLSSGPAYWLATRGYIGHWYGRIYSPLIWLASKFDPFAKLFFWWADLFNS